MIKYKDKTLEDYFIDPVTAVITNSQGEVQETSIHKDGRPYFKSMRIHVIQVHTHLGYKKGLVIHHLDNNPMNNALSNLIYITQNEHLAIHNKERKGKKNPMYGKHHSEEARKNMSIAQKGKKLSEETKKKISETLKGHKVYEETKRKISEVLKGRQLSEEHKQKMSAAIKGKNKDKMWINNGIEQRFVHFDEEIPEGFVRGRLK